MFIWYEETAMTKYSDIEIQTANKLLEKGYKWIVREINGDLFIYKNKPQKNHNAHIYDDIWQGDDECTWICGIDIPIFQNITCVDKEPVSLESIVHPRI